MTEEDTLEVIKSTYGPLIKKAANKYGHRPEVLAGIMMRESRGGFALRPLGPWGTGDGGHGHGLMQIDDRSFPQFCDSLDWGDPERNILFGALVLSNKKGYLRAHTHLTGEALERAAIAAYNCGEGNVRKGIENGEDIDNRTAHKNYSKEVLRFAKIYVDIKES